MDLFTPLQQIIQTYLPPSQIELIKEAFQLAQIAHNGQVRSSGEPYVTHPVAVACIVAEMKLDHEAVMAALLHDVIEDSDYTQEYLATKFGKSVADIVEGVSKLDKLKFRTRQEAQVANFQKMILAMTEDIRVVLIKLADRTHNMRTLSALRPEKRRRIAKETLEIFAPLAHRLGIEHIRLELEDLGFEAMYPHRYLTLKKAIDLAKQNKQELLQEIIHTIQTKLKDAQIEANVFVRERNLYSIYQKLRQKTKAINSIFDVQFFCVTVKNIDQCYLSLGRIHNLYKPRPQQVKDYIAVPKINGYQSLQTSLIGGKGFPIEVHICTEEMWEMAEMGVTVNWQSLQQLGCDATHVQINAQNWLKSLVELKHNAGNSFEFIEVVKSEFFHKEIYVFTPKGRIIELPKGATPVDFAYAVHTDIGNNCVACKVDHKSYPLSQPLVSGQTVEIITMNHARPNANWLHFVATAKARTKIRQSLKNLQYDEAKTWGKYQLENVIFPQKISAISNDNINKVLKDLNLNSLDELYYQIGLGNVISGIIACQLMGKSVEIDTDNNPQNNRPLAIGCMDNLINNLAKCCYPIPGDPIIAIFNPGKGFMIHHEHCKNAHAGKNSQIMAVNWEKAETKKYFEVALRIKMLNQSHSISSLMTVIINNNSQIRSIWTEEKNDHLYEIILLISVVNIGHLEQIMQKIQRLDGFSHIERNINAK